MTFAEVAAAASRQPNSSIAIGMPLFLSCPLYPVKSGVPPPASVTLDLSGCIGCMSLTDNGVVVYLSNLHLTGLAPLLASGTRDSSSGSSSGNSGSGDLLALPLWAFRFNRCPNCSTGIWLHNVSLTLPVEEYSLLLASLTAAAEPGSEADPLPAGLSYAQASACHTSYSCSSYSCSYSHSRFHHHRHHHTHYHHHLLTTIIIAMLILTTITFLATYPPT